MKTLIFITVLLLRVTDASNLQNVEDTYFYYGGGISFILPFNWNENSNLDEKTKKH